MNNTKRITSWLRRGMVVTLSAFLTTTANGTPRSVSWICTTEQNPWVDKGNLQLTDWDDDTAHCIIIDESTTFQEIDGWGGAINGLGWVALSVLSEEERADVLKTVFDTSGCAFNIGRISIGANDYSVAHYSCSETPDDYTMSHFSLDKDKVNVIPFALAAKAINPDMLFWGSPHSPPAWMKQNNSLIDGSLKTDDATRKAYALYFEKWITGMEVEGVHIYSIHVQNEPNISGTGYPCCIMSGAEMGILIKDYIGPQLRSAGLSTEIWAGTFHSTNPGGTSFYPEYIPPTLGDPQANPFISGVGLQWNALTYAHEVIENYPAVKMMQTETQCGNFFWSPEYDSVAAPNDWGYGVFTFHRMLQWLRAGVNSYCQWNIILDEKGISNSTTRPWPQNSMISVNKSTGEVRYNPQFFAARHISHFVKPQARRIATTGNFAVGGSNLLSANIEERVSDGDMMAFRNSNGDKVLVARNTSNADITAAVKVGSIKFKPVIPANSINTFLITDPAAVRHEKTASSSVRPVSIQMTAGNVCITVRTAGGSPVACTLFDGCGRTVTTIRQSSQKGTTAILWNRTNAHGGRVTPGVYFVRIVSGDRLYRGKLALP